MKKSNFFGLAAIVNALLLIILVACNTQVNEQESNIKTPPESRESIPDSVIQFLITSAAIDFNEHQPPIAIDFRNVKAGFISSDNVRIYLICGEFFSQEKKVWDSFTTIKTSDYEQYLGTTTYCEDATFVETDSNRLSDEIKKN